MRSFLRLALGLAVPGVLFAGCESEGSAPPAAELFADPEVCDVPCEVVLDSGLEPSEGQLLTFTWNFGDGPVPGDARLLHRFEEAGTYTVTVTASDGQSSTTDTTTVLVEAQPKASGAIDETGGSVSQGACTVTVPEGVAPEALTLELTELPSMQIAAERSIGTGELTALGNAYDVDMLLKPSTAVAISVKDADAQGVDPSELAWLVRMIAHPVPPADRHDFVYSAAPLADYVLVPVTSVDEDGTAHGEIYGRKRFQLVRLNEPLNAEPVAVEADTAQKALSPPAPVIIFKRNPSRITITDYKNAIVEGLKKSRQVLVDDGPFRGPEGAVVVYVGKLKNSNWDAFVPFFDRHTIHMSYTLESTDVVKKAVAHEYFHLIQNHYTNRLSSSINHQLDGWFTEGTASWAMDEVFDDIRDTYHATSWTRFETPLLKKSTGTAATHAYENVAFWKWAETTNETIIRRMLEDHYASTHSTLPGARNPVENFANVDFLLSLKKLWGYVDFLDFAYTARYLKDFDTGETRDGEIWSKGVKELGRPKAIEFRTSTAVSTVAGGAPENAATVEFGLKPHLTAEVIQVTSVDLTGTLHVRFVAPAPPLDAKLFVVDKASYDEIESDTVRDTSSAGRDLTAKLSPDEHAYIVVVDPRWNHAPSTGLIDVKIEVWVEDPCGSLPANVVDVSTEDELQSALLGATPGTAIRLAAGSYSPPIISWPTPEFGPFGANLLVRDTTLIGAGEGQTRIVMTGDPYAGLGLKTYGNATLRNLTIDAGDSEPVIDCLDAKHVTLCNVTIEASSTTDYGIIWGPWNGGSTSLSLYDSALAHPNREHFGIGILLQSCYETPATVSAELSLTRVSGWGQGVLYFAGEGQCGSVSVSADCDGFSNNDYNVVEEDCRGGMCVSNERCP